MARVWLLGPPTTDASVSALVTALANCGLNVAGPDLQQPAGTVDAVAVLLGIGGLSSNQLAAAKNWADRLIPISVDGRVHDEFSGENQILLPTVGVTAAAAQVAMLASIGGTAFVEIRRILAKADAWKQGDRRRLLLATVDETDRARAVLASTPPGIDTSTANALVEASAHHHRLRRRLINLIVVAIVLVLAGAITIAVLQRNAAASAASSLTHHADQAASQRLSGLAISLLDSDPDLPRLAALQALHDDLGPEAAAAARQVITQTLAHRSYLLPGLPRSVSAAGTSVAVTYVDGTVDIRSSTDGSLIRALPPGPRALSAVLSPDGRYVALFAPTGYTIEKVADGSTVSTGPSTFGVWVGGSTLLVATPAGLSGIEMPGPSASRVVVPPVPGGLAAIAVSADGSLVATAVANDVSVWSTRTGGGRFHAIVPNISDLEFDASGALLVLQANGWKVVPHPDEPAASSIDGTTGIDTRNLADIRPLTTGGFVGVDSTGRYGLVTGVGAGVLQTVYGRAHRGLATGDAPLSDGGFATVGADRYLRIWNAPVLPAYPAGVAFYEYWPRIAATAREGQRPTMALSGDGHTLTVTQQSPSYVQEVDVATLKSVVDKAKNHYLGDITVKTTPCGNAGLIMWVSQSGGASLVNLATGDVTDQTRVPADTDIVDSHLGCTADGTQLAWADDRELRIWDQQLSRWLVAPVEGTDGPVSVLASAGPISIATRGGDRVTLTETGQIGRVRLTPQGITTTAAGESPQGEYYAMGSDGVMYSSTDVSPPSALASPDANLEAYAVRCSPDGRYVAVVGNSDTQIVDTATGAIALTLSAGDNRQPVRDVAFTPDALVLLDATGGLTRYPFPDDGHLAAVLGQAPRRASTDDVAIGLDANLGSRP